MKKFLINYIDFSAKITDGSIGFLNNWIDVSKFSEERTVLAQFCKTLILDETNNVFSCEDAIDFFYTNFPKSSAIVTIDKFDAKYSLPEFNQQ